MDLFGTRVTGGKKKSFRVKNLLEVLKVTSVYVFDNSIKIKKFYQFINESEKYNILKKYITQEDMEDEFLRLKEVFGCSIKMHYFGTAWNILIVFKESANKTKIMPEDRAGEILQEIYFVEQRIKIMHPEFEIDWGTSGKNDHKIMISDSKWIYFKVHFLPEFKYIEE